jgi:hypothetical protein
MSISAAARLATLPSSPMTRQLMFSASTTDPKVAFAASGLSCHYWLHPVKPCAGSPLRKQLVDIATG